MTGSRRIVLVNALAGTVRTRGAEAVEALIRDTLGEDADVELFQGDPAPLVRKALESGQYGTIIAGGGDGTICSVADLIIRHGTGGVTFGVLPLGTMNLLCKAIGLKPDLETALAQLADAQAQAIDTGEVNGKTFLLHLSFGLQPRLARLREALGYRSRLTKMLAGARAFLSVMARPRPVSISLSGDGISRKINAPLVVISNNELGGAYAYVPKTLSDGILGIYVVTELSYWRIAGLAADVLAGRWSESAHVDAKTAHDLTIERRSRFSRRRKSITASVDGEVMKLQLPLAVKIRPLSLKVLVPAAET